jgi:predicted unusual protein kinase regulating ubiquinone biosynthesis (AarF/ABC1/UbiB family)
MTAGERLYRARRIGMTFGRIYLGAKANQFLERRLRPTDMKRRWSRFHRQSAESIYEAAVELRGMILKGCQFIGSRADAMPPEYVEILSQLQDEVPPHPYEEIRQRVEDELGAPLDRIFAEFDHEPIAAASLAQVHRARLHDGRDVAVKVQYPGIDELVRSDLANLGALFRAVGFVERDFDVMPLLDELALHVPRELDFVNEGRNAEEIGKLFEGRADLHIPAIVWEHTTARVLVSEFVDGIKISDRARLEAAGVSRDRVMRTLVDAYCLQILRHGFFHADPHPGNLLVVPGEAGDAPVVVFLDFGLAKRLPMAFRTAALAFVTALIQGDPAAMARALVDLGFETRDDPERALEAICRVLLDVAKQMRGRAFVDARVVREAGEELPRLIRENPIVDVPSHIVFVGRVFALLSGLGSTLDVRVDMVKWVLPYLVDLPPAATPPRGAP